MASENLGENIVLRLSTYGDGWAGRIKQTIREWAAGGMGEKEIIERLTSELTSGGGIFESIMRGFGETTGGAVDYIANAQTFSEWEGEDAWEWITMRDQYVCDEVASDCESRDSVIKSYSEWVAMGLPGAGTTTCRYRCRCIIRPVNK